METLVIKNNLLSGGTQKLYRDVIVENGTLFCFDFSNAGCVRNGDLNTVRDLAAESKEELGIPNLVSFDVTDRGEVPALTDKQGYPIVNLGSYSGNAYDSGLNIYGIDEYLFQNQPENMLVTLWVGANDDIIDGVSNDWVKTGNRDNLRCAGGGISQTTSVFLTSSTVVQEELPNIKQITVERKGNGVPNSIYINGQFAGEGSANAVLFKENTGNNPMSIGCKTPNDSTSLVLYRAFMEDLTVSGRTALEVVQKDYSYVNGVGEYSGIDPRPYANL